MRLWPTQGVPRKAAAEFLKAAWPIDPAQLEVVTDCSSTLVHPSGLTEAGLIDESDKLAKRFSTDDSGRFVNGMLTSIRAAARPDEPNGS